VSLFCLKRDVAPTQSGTHHCKAHGGGKRCQALDCPKSAAGSTLYCIAHGGGKRCQHTGCTKSAQGNTNLCKAHGGGKRCQQEGCNLPSRGPVNGMWMCAAHGGGPKCQELCGKSAVGITKFCILHGKNRPCKTTGCIGTTLLGGNPFCPLHGGARQCAFPDCKHLVKGQHRAGVEMCATHGGGQRCEHDGCQHAVAPGGTQKYCMAHGGGRRCMQVKEKAPACGYAPHVTGIRWLAHTRSVEFRAAHARRGCGSRERAQEGCNKAAGEGMMQYCQEHGGGRRCKHPGCMASTAKLKGSAQFCREHAGLQCALDGCTRLAAGGGMTLCKPCMQHLDGKAPSGQGDDFDDDVMAADRMDLSGEPTISLDEVGFLPYRLQVEVAANLDGGEPAPQPPAEVFALGLHGDNGGVGTSHGGGDGMQREAAATSALAADAGMLSATRCDYDGCEAPRLDDGLFCELHTAHCPVVGCGRVAAPGAVQCVLHETRTQGSIKRPRCCEHPDCYKAAARVGANVSAPLVSSALLSRTLRRRHEPRWGSESLWISSWAEPCGYFGADVYQSRWRQALHVRGVHEECTGQYHAVQGARRRQALREGGM
jgi:hypothetical protein